MERWMKEIDEIESEIEELKKQKQFRTHFAHSNEQDYDIKNKIIEKQNSLLKY